MASIVFAAGDPSGDGHAAALISALVRRDPSLQFAGLGGPAMQHAGMTLLDNLTTAAAIGPFDAARHFSHLLRARHLLDEHLKTHHPDLAVLIDFGDFNLPVIAPLLKRHGVPVAYYISPQLWAWGRFRLRYVRRYVKQMIVLFPFEEAFYREAGVPVTWVGHPLIDAVRPTMSKIDALEHFGLNPWRRTVGLLPGSRAQEIHRHLPLMRAAAQQIAWHMPGVQFLLPKAPGVQRRQLEAGLARSGVTTYIAEGSVYDALQLMDAAIVASGTATLQTALAGVPMAVMYRTSWPTYVVSRMVLRVPHIAMVNVVAGREAVPEFVQRRANPKRIAETVVGLLRDERRAARMRTDLAEVAVKLGPPGAVERTADAVLAALQQR